MDPLDPIIWYQRPGLPTRGLEIRQPLSATIGGAVPPSLTTTTNMSLHPPQNPPSSLLAYRDKMAEIQATINSTHQTLDKMANQLAAFQAWYGLSPSFSYLSPPPSSTPYQPYGFPYPQHSTMESHPHNIVQGHSFTPASSLASYQHPPNVSPSHQYHSPTPYQPICSSSFAQPAHAKPSPPPKGYVFSLQTDPPTPLNDPPLSLLHPTPPLPSATPILSDESRRFHYLEASRPTQGNFHSVSASFSDAVSVTAPGSEVVSTTAHHELLFPTIEQALSSSSPNGSPTSLSPTQYHTPPWNPHHSSSSVAPSRDVQVDLQDYVYEPKETTLKEETSVDDALQVLDELLDPELQEDDEFADVEIGLVNMKVDSFVEASDCFNHSLDISASLVSKAGHDAPLLTQEDALGDGIFSEIDFVDLDGGDTFGSLVVEVGDVYEAHSHFEEPLCSFQMPSKPPGITPTPVVYDEIFIQLEDEGITEAVTCSAESRDVLRGDEVALDVVVSVVDWPEKSRADCEVGDCSMVQEAVPELAIRAAGTLQLRRLGYEHRVLTLGLRARPYHFAVNDMIGRPSTIDWYNNPTLSEVHNQVDFSHHKVSAPCYLHAHSMNSIIEVKMHDNPKLVTYLLPVSSITVSRFRYASIWEMRLTEQATDFSRRVIERQISGRDKNALRAVLLRSRLRKSTCVGKLENAFMDDSKVDAHSSVIQRNRSFEHSRYINTLQLFVWIRNTGNLKFSVGSFNLGFCEFNGRLKQLAGDTLIQEIVIEVECQLSYHVFNNLIYICSKLTHIELEATLFKTMIEHRIQRNITTLGMLLGLHQKIRTVDEVTLAFSPMRTIEVVCQSTHSAMTTSDAHISLSKRAGEHFGLLTAAGVISLTCPHLMLPRVLLRVKDTTLFEMYSIELPNVVVTKNKWKLLWRNAFTYVADGDTRPYTSGMNAYSLTFILVTEVPDVLMTCIILHKENGLLVESFTFVWGLYIVLILEKMSDRRSLIGYTVQFDTREHQVLRCELASNWTLHSACKRQFSLVGPAIVVVMASDGEFFPKLEEVAHVSLYAVEVHVGTPLGSYGNLIAAKEFVSVFHELMEIGVRVVSYGHANEDLKPFANIIRIEQYCCMVALYCRARLVAETYKSIVGIRTKSHNIVWTTILGCYLLHFGFDVADHVSSHLGPANPTNTNGNVLLIIAIDALLSMIQTCNSRYEGYIVCCLLYTGEEDWYELSELKKLMQAHTYGEENKFVAAKIMSIFFIKNFEIEAAYLAATIHTKGVIMLAYFNRSKSHANKDARVMACLEVYTSILICLHQCVIIDTASQMTKYVSRNLMSTATEEQNTSTLKVIISLLGKTKHLSSTMLSIAAPVSQVDLATFIIHKLMVTLILAARYFLMDAIFNLIKSSNILDVSSLRTSLFLWGEDLLGSFLIGMSLSPLSSSPSLGPTSISARLH